MFKSMLQNVGRKATSCAKSGVEFLKRRASDGADFVKRHASEAVAIGIGGLALFGGTVAKADDPNVGISNVKAAVDGLSSQLGPIVLSGIGVAIIGIGAVIALGLAKRLMGK